MVIAIVDDDRAMLMGLKESIVSCFDDEVEVLLFSNTNQLDKNTKKIDTYIIDYNLEDDLNGIEIIKKLKDSGFIGKIIFISGEGDYSLRMKIKLTCNDCEFISKGQKGFHEEIIKEIEKNFN